MIWIMAAGSAGLLITEAAGSCFRLRIGVGCLTLMRMTGGKVVPWQCIKGWRRWRRVLPQVLRMAVPFLPPGPAGLILLARDSTGVELRLMDGRSVRVPREHFVKGEAQLLKAVGRHGVPHLSGGAAVRAG
ncbi:MAG: hypothetical protein Q8P60_15770 [Pseudorhodobacter sp.]|nr:hypothetical protein [Pseudorhodobacter sp.]